MNSSLIVLAAALAAAAPCKKEGGQMPQLELRALATGLKAPVHATGAGDGSGRIFVVEQAGRIRIVKDGQLLSEPFLDIRRKVRSGGEMGLLSMAFHPRDKSRFFVNYTANLAGKLHTIVSELRAKGDRAAGSEKVLLNIRQPYANHNGGQLAFGPDGLLYIGMGDGGSGDDPHNNGQRLDTLLGKMLTLDVDKPQAAPEIFAWGLRNPWRFAFDPLTGKLWAGDVGQDHWEEIDVVEKGKNYGWRVMEGFHCNPGIKKDCETKGLVLPAHEYPRSQGISVTGGFVYRGARIPELCGAYLFADYGDGTLWGLQKKKHAVLSDTGLNISSFGQDDALELYVVDHGGRLLEIHAKP